MTDDRFEKVRAWAKENLYKVQKEIAKMFGFSEELYPELIARRVVLKDLIYFLDSMQEEPKFQIGQTITDPADSTFTFHINRIEDGKYIESDDAWVLTKDADEDYQLVEEHVSEDLEEAAKAYSAYERGDDTEVGYDINRYEGFIAGSNWQKEKEYTCYEEAFEDGAKWKHEQMMKGAVEAEVEGISKSVLNGSWGYFKVEGNYKNGEKLKIIVLKENKI